MRKQYENFSQLNLKDMCKSISDMTLLYIDPETGNPTKVPPIHYEKILNQVTEKYMSDVTSMQMLSIMYTQLNNLRKEDEDYFYKALVCIDLGINPKDLRVDEQIAISYTKNYISEKKNLEKKDFHFLDKSILDSFSYAKNDSEILVQAIKKNNKSNKQEYDMHHHKDYER